MLNTLIRKNGLAAPVAPLALLALCAGLALGCSEDKNGAPELLPIDDRTFQVNQSGSIDLVAADPEGNDLTFSVEIEPQPPTQTASAGAPRVTKISRQKGLFTWTPGIADAGGERFKEYALTFTVSDGRGGEDVERISIRVENPGVGGSSSLRFADPPGLGMAVDLTQSSCVDQVPVTVVADTVLSEDVTLELAEPIPERATLSPSGPGKSKFFNWCPTEEQLDRSLAHTVIFTAKAPGDDPITKRFLVRFKRNAGAGCAGESPMIVHTPQDAYSGPLNYEIEATITDDVGFKAPPVLVFAGDDAIGDDTADWQLVEFGHNEGDRWVASIPNLNLGVGEQQRVRYRIIATDNDDAESTRCDHTSETETFEFTAIGGGASGNTYGLCAECVADAQCGSAADLCVDLRGESFCGRSCDGGCGPGEQCLEILSVDGTTGQQCLPADLNCGQICFPDAFDVDAPNDTPQQSSVIEAGTYSGLTLCDQDQDYFAVPVEAGESLRVRALFDNATGDIDLFMARPDAEAFDYQSLNGDTDVEEVYEGCLPTGGVAVIGVLPYDGAINTYDLVVERGAGDCNRMCDDDAFEAQGGDTLNDAVLFDAAELPLLRDGLTICAGDSDHFGFEARPGQVVVAEIEFPHLQGNLNMRLARLQGGAIVAESADFRDTELLEVPIGEEDLYVVEVYGATPEVSNDYILYIDVIEAQGCARTTECPVGQHCADGACTESICNGFGECALGHTCAPSRAGLDPSSAGGTCFAYCESDLGCRQAAGFACKRFEDFTQACAPAGDSGPGTGCNGLGDCAGELVCFAAPGGYCAAGGCAPGECAEGTVCGELNNFDACLKTCRDDGDCRIGEGYRCADVGGGVTACVP